LTVWSWLGSQLMPGAPGFWLLIDMLASGVLWFALPRTPIRWQSLLRVLTWILIPWLALMLGVVSTQAMGLTHIDWQSTLTIGLGIVLTVLALFATVRYTLRTTEPLPAESEFLLAQPHTPWLPFYAALYHGAEQLHWCFQRAVVAALLVTAPWTMETPAYWALWLATLLALPGIFRYRKGVVRLHALVALLATAILFFYTRNFWLCWLLHAGIMIMAGSTHTRPELEQSISR
jgi:hypothetical protein